ESLQLFPGRDEFVDPLQGGRGFLTRARLPSPNRATTSASVALYSPLGKSPWLLKSGSAIGTGPRRKQEIASDGIVPQCPHQVSAGRSVLPPVSGCTATARRARND